jgi:AraC-like DNA-binding protein
VEDTKKQCAAIQGELPAVTMRVAQFSAGKLSIEQVVLLVSAIAAALFAVTVEGFATVSNLENLARNSAPLLILSCAMEQYELQCAGDVRSFYLEIPRDKFAQRFPKDSAPLCAPIDCTQGLGRIATEFCAFLATEDPNLGNDIRAELGDQLLDILALTLISKGSDQHLSESSVQKARLRSVQRWIEEHLGDPNLTLEKIARANNMSLRYLHLLFRQIDMSVSNWLWDRRLQRCYGAIASVDNRSITAIAFDHGFNSSAHFSTMFRRKFGFRPSDLRRSQ